jgi:hypothetical protein
MVYGTAGNVLEKLQRTLVLKNMVNIFFYIIVLE